MQSYTVKLKNRKEVAAGTMAFYFDKPKGFVFTAGQHILITLVNPPETDTEGDRRVFCFASAPYEKDLMIAMRMRDTAFKRVLKTLPFGSEIQMEGPYGTFVLDRLSARPAVFLAGGIGITPFRSMILQAIKENLAHRLLLFYSNRRPEDTAFLDELQCSSTRRMQGEESKYTCVATMTEVRKSSLGWSGERGYITKEMLGRHLEDLEKPIYYVAGPPAFVLAMRGMLYEKGVAEENTKIDQFGGY